MASMIRGIVKGAGSAPAPEGSSTTGMQLMLPVTSFLTGNIDIRPSKTLSGSLAIAAQWTALELDHSTEDFGTEITVGIADTTKQLIADVTGSGLITQICSSALDAALSGTMTVTIEIDGIEIPLFVSDTLPTGSARLCIGDFKNHSVTGTGTAAEGIGGSHDSGYCDLLTANGWIPTPKQTTSEGRIGLVYHESFKVWMKGSVALHSGANYNKALVSYTKSIPYGVVSSGGALQKFTMPHCIVKATDLSLKSSISSQRVSSNNDFFDALELDHAPKNYKTETTTTIADTSEQVIFNLTGPLIITHIVASALSAAGLMTVTVTIPDKDPIIFSSGTTTADDARLCIGDFRQWQATSSYYASTDGGKQDQGFGVLPKATMVTPIQTISDRNIGIIVETTAEIKLQGSVSLEATIKGEAAVSYLNYIPYGLV